MDSFGAQGRLRVGELDYEVYRLSALADRGLDPGRLPISLRLMLENLLRHEDGRSVTAEDIEALARWEPSAAPQREIAFRPARVVLQDLTGVPAVVDLAAMREAMAELGGDPESINPLEPVELVIDHSVHVDVSGSSDAFGRNVEREYERNRERYAFLRWGQESFENFKVVPPGTGIVHQVNLEYLSRVVFAGEGRPGESGLPRAYPDTLLGTDSHTTMVNGLGVLGWGVGGIEAEAAMLGQPVSMLIPQVVGVRLSGELLEGTTATDLVLRVTELLRAFGVVGKFVEFFGLGLDHLSLADRATIANMCPEYGATCGLFPVDEETLRYLRLSGRSEAQVGQVEAYLKEQGLFRTKETPEPEYTEVVELDLGSIEPSISGPRRPQDRIPLSWAKRAFHDTTETMTRGDTPAPASEQINRWETEGGRVLPDYAGEPSAVAIDLDGETCTLHHGSVVIAAITSCTNTSNPSVMLAAGLLARKAVERGLETPPWVKTSLAPGSQVVTEYLKAAGLMSYLEQLRFHLVGYGCTTCIGNSGPLAEPVEAAIREGDLIVSSVLSGNRNFEARIHQAVRSNYLMSPPLVVAYALAGRMDVDLTSEPLGRGRDGEPVFLRDVWPTNRELRELLASSVEADQFRDTYRRVYEGDERWNALPVPRGARFGWVSDSTYLRLPPYFEGWRSGVGAPGRQCHDRPHLTGREHRSGNASRSLPRGAWGRPSGLELLRLAAGQPRGHDAWDLRERALAQSPAPRDRGRSHRAPAERRGDLDLRGGHELPGRRRACPRDRWQGVRDGLEPRLGRQGLPSAGRARRDRRELRAHPSLEPGGDGRTAARVHAGRDGLEPRSHRPRGL
jgi:aconitate hydratase